MKSDNNRLITREELAEELGLSKDVIRRNESSMGLIPCKVLINGRLLRYRRKAAFKALRENGIIE